ncbi:major facilitator superfamily domain-containing protein [Dendryphion nanum]|uniref:Major facilitator superfamily domain-containing protein n=1 Tax=Dendryphion nanum TaxID=256645 RepID=A0A9P9CZX1_9PLEO|nr:major facilitator superfamily domain-containing protein [Dendryphion nanum]
MAKQSEKSTNNAMLVEDIVHPPQVQEASSVELDALDKTEAYQEGASQGFTLEEQNRIMRKVDWRVVPLLTFLYLVSFIDRSNIGNAKIAGMNSDLNLHGLQYNAAVTLFYVPYTLLEVPSNVVLKLMRPSIWISILLFSWGLVMTLMGLVESYSGLLAARWFLGVAEAGFFPAATFLLTIWYRRYEYQRRFAIFFSMASMAGAFSGLLAFAIEKMDGIGGRKGWQWIFILEGLVPVATSFVVWKILPDSPETAKFLDARERKFVVDRIAEETGSGEGRVTNTDKIRFHHVVSAFKEWKIWAKVFVYWGNSVGVYGFTATVPTVINQLGYTRAQAQLLTVPIYVFAVILILFFAFLSDRYQVKWVFIVIPYSIAACSLIAQLAIPHPKYPGVTLGFLFGIAGGLYSGFPPLIAWSANNVAPSSKRAVAMALLISVGNMGAIAGSNVYIAREAPVYHLGFGASFAFTAFAIIVTCLLRVAYGMENKRRDRLVEELGGEIGVKSRYSEQELLDMGDRSPFFRYAL